MAGCLLQPPAPGRAGAQANTATWLSPGPAETPCGMHDPPVLPSEERVSPRAAPAPPLRRSQVRFDPPALAAVTFSKSTRGRRQLMELWLLPSLEAQPSAPRALLGSPPCLESNALSSPSSAWACLSPSGMGHPIGRGTTIPLKCSHLWGGKGAPLKHHRDKLLHPMDGVGGKTPGPRVRAQRRHLDQAQWGFNRPGAGSAGRRSQSSSSTSTHQPSSSRC